MNRDYDIATENVIKKAFVYSKKIMRTTASLVKRLRTNFNINDFVRDLKSSMTKPTKELYERLKSVDIACRSYNEERTVRLLNVAIGALYLFKDKKFYDLICGYIKMTGNIDNNSSIEWKLKYCQNIKLFYEDVVNGMTNGQNAATKSNKNTNDGPIVLSEADCDQIGKALKAYFELTPKVAIKIQYLLESMDMDDKEQLAKFDESLKLVKSAQLEIKNSCDYIYSLYKHLSMDKKSRFFNKYGYFM